MTHLFVASELIRITITTRKNREGVNLPSLFESYVARATELLTPFRVKEMLCHLSYALQLMQILLLRRSPPPQAFFGFLSKIFFSRTYSA